MAKYILSDGLQPFVNQAAKRESATGSVTVNNHDIVHPSSVAASNRRVHFLGEQNAALLVKWSASVYLAPVLNAGHALHVTPQHGSHALVLDFRDFLMHEHQI